MDKVTNRDWITKEEAEVFIGKNSPYYIYQWKTHSDKKLKGWNWAAALFTIEWMIYRRMLKEGIISYVFLLALYVGVTVSLKYGFGIFGIIGVLIVFIFRITLGIFGNSLYRKKALRCLRMVAGESDNKKLEFLRQAGGASIPAVVYFILINIAINKSLSVFIP